METSELIEARSWLSSKRTDSGRLPESARAQVVELIERARAAGHSYRAVAGALGVSFHTMMGWRQRARAASTKSKLSPVRVEPRSRPATAREGLVVRGPRGLAVEGMTVADVAELWMRLS